VRRECAIGGLSQSEAMSTNENVDMEELSYEK
jgi:hypothetical protein